MSFEDYIDHEARKPELEPGFDDDGNPRTKMFCQLQSAHLLLNHKSNRFVRAFLKPVESPTIDGPGQTTLLRKLLKERAEGNIKTWDEFLKENEKLIDSVKEK